MPKYKLKLIFSFKESVSYDFLIPMQFFAFVLIKQTFKIFILHWPQQLEQQINTSLLLQNVATTNKDKTTTKFYIFFNLFVCPWFLPMFSKVQFGFKIDTTNKHLFNFYVSNVCPIWFDLVPVFCILLF